MTVFPLLRWTSVSLSTPDEETERKSAGVVRDFFPFLDEFNQDWDFPPPCGLL